MNFSFYIHQKKHLHPQKKKQKKPKTNKKPQQPHIPAGGGGRRGWSALICLYHEYLAKNPDFSAIFVRPGGVLPKIERKKVNVQGRGGRGGPWRVAKFLSESNSFPYKVKSSWKCSPHPNIFRLSKEKRRCGWRKKLRFLKNFRLFESLI